LTECAWQYELIEQVINNLRNAGITLVSKSAWAKNRLEAFSDGVIAINISISITIMVLELKVPRSPISARCCSCRRCS